MKSETHELEREQGVIEDLPAACALIAVAACYELGRFRVRCRPLAITYRRRPKHRHIITVFQFEGRLRGYDHTGSVTLAKTLTFESRPKAIAKSWRKCPGVDFPFKVLAASWY